MTAKLSHKQRLERLVSGQEIDRPPVSAWRHYFTRESSASDLARAMLEFQNAFDWDFMKINPRASYYVEDWGVKFAYSDKPDEKPTLIKAPVKYSEDWLKIKPLDITNGAYAEQLKAVELIGKDLEGKLDYFQTVFSPLSVAADLCATDDDFKILLDTGNNLEPVLEAITVTLARYVQQLMRLGVSGIFFATTEWATRDNITEEQYLIYGQPYDLQVLEMAKTAKFNILHVCKADNMLPLFKHYPGDILSWNKFESGNLDFFQADKIFTKTFLGGIDHIDTLAKGTPEEIKAQVAVSLAESHPHQLIIGPGCALKMGTPEINLRALRNSVD